MQQEIENAIIKHVSDWGSGYDQLSGVPIHDAEKLRVHFPDGEFRIVTVNVVVTYGSYMDHGHQHETQQRRAYWSGNLFGVDVLVPLVGLVAERIIS